MNRPVARPANRYGLAFLLTAQIVLAPGVVLAQTPVTTLTQDDIEQIVVTGSRIARPELTAMSPFAVIDEGTITLSNQTNIENVLRNLPQFAQAIGSNTNNGNDGSATVDLRQLGEARTLVLVNGKRFVPYDYQGFVDLSMIPVSLIERVEVITGGASAVYGSDAVAGVVNFIMKNDFEGLEVNSSYNVTDEGDGDTYDFNITAGSNFAGGRGNIVFNLGYTNQDPISQGERSYGAEPLSSYDLAFTGSYTTPYSIIDSPLTCTGFDASGDPDGGLCAPNFNYTPYELYQVPQKKWTSTALGTYEIDETTEFFFRASFANNRVNTQLAPTGTFGAPFTINVNNPLLTPATRSLLQDIEADEGDGDGLANVALYRRLSELGARDSEYENTAYQFVGGLRGKILDDQDWEVFGQYGRTSRTQNFFNDSNLALLQQSLLSDDGITCRPPAASNCVPGNYFGEGNLDPDVPNFLRLNLNETDKTDQLIFGASLSGDLPLELPAAGSPLSYAVGVEFRREQADNNPDDNYEQGIAAGFGSSSPVDAEIEITEVFGEFLLPIVTDARFAKSINIEGGIRYAQYENDVDTASGAADNRFYNDSYKFGVDWSPREDLRFNVMYQRAVRAPNLSEIGLPKTPSVGSLDNDPCDDDNPPTDAALIALCEATGVPAGQVGSFTSIIAGQIGNFLGGNPELEPEKADTWTYGVKWRPSFVENLSVSIDYYDIDIDDAITQLVEQDIVNICYFTEQDANGDFCQLIARSPLTGSLNGGSTVGVSRVYQNSANETARGIDFDIRYSFDIEGAGSIDLSWAANYVIERESKPATGMDSYDCAGLVGNTCLRPTPEWSFVQSTRWIKGPVTLQLLWRYIDSISQDSVAFGNAAASDYAVPTIASQSFFDLSGTYELDENWTIRAGISNLFDRDPPIVGNDYAGITENGGNTFPATYPSLGRGYYIGATARF